ncbi:hypothetical protein [Hyphococcus sp.]|uniref:hypothetical protein n=1 Tax=Hyphococcus sp. TaxID=2038636 RepID=UPI003CCBA770
MTMLANGWPLALAGFFIGVLANEIFARARKGSAPRLKLKPGEDVLSALQSEIRAAKEMLEAEHEEDAANEEALKNLDEAVKRANGRLKLITKAIKRGK